METKFNFNSQVATSRSQSERLLALGLKKETADMCWTQEEDGWGEFRWFCRAGTYTESDAETFFDYIPAWSLHRLIEILDTNPCVFYTNCGYDNIIDRIEDYIKEGIIDTRYLEEWCLNEEE